MSDDVDEALTRIEDFLAVQTAGGSRIGLDNVLRLQESVGVDDDTRAVFVQRLSAVQPDAPAGAVLLGSARRVVGRAAAGGEGVSLHCQVAVADGDLPLMAATIEDLAAPTLVSDWHDAGAVDAVLLVREVERREKRDGSPFLRLVLGDRSGTIGAVMWSPEEVSETIDAGAPVRVRGCCADHPRYGRQLTVTALHPAHEHEVDWAVLLEGPVRTAAVLEAGLDELLASITQPHLAALMARLLGRDTLTGRRFRVAPAAKFNHHAYRHGLLEHSLDVAQGVDALSAIFAADRDVAVCGALLHDIGKLEAYAADPGGVCLTDHGKLLGEIPLGHYRVRREIERDPTFPAQIAQCLLHIVLSHHGRLEFGSPVTPSTREATLVHTVDNLSGQMGAFDRLAKQAGDDAWSRYDRVLETAAYFPPGVSPDKR